MSDVLHITGSPVYDTSIIKRELRSYTPFVESYNNSDEIRITIQNQDLIVLPSESYLCFTVNYTAKNAQGADIASKLQNNFMAFLFDEIRYEICGTLVDRTRNLGITTSLKNYMSLTRQESENLSYSGWLFENADNHPDTTSKFEVCLPLKKLLGFCEDYRKVILAVKHEIIIIRSKTNNNSVLLDADSTFDLKLSRVQWKMPVVQVDDVRKLSLMKIVNNDQFLSMPFRSWDLYEYPTLPTTSKHIWNVKTSTQLEKPRFILFGLQTDRKNKSQTDTSMFDSANLGSIRVFLNSTPYPNEEVRFNFQECFGQIYEAYNSFRKAFYGDLESSPMLTMNELKKQGLIFIDCSHQEDNLKSSVVDLAIHIETTDGAPFADNTTAYALIIHDKIVQYNPLSNNIRKIT